MSAQTIEEQPSRVRVMDTAGALIDALHEGNAAEAHAIWRGLSFKDQPQVAGALAVHALLANATAIEIGHGDAEATLRRKITVATVKGDDTADIWQMFEARS